MLRGLRLPKVPAMESLLIEAARSMPTPPPVALPSPCALERETWPSRPGSPSSCPVKGSTPLSSTTWNPVCRPSKASVASLRLVGFGVFRAGLERLACGRRPAGGETVGLTWPGLGLGAASSGRGR